MKALLIITTLALFSFSSQSQVVNGYFSSIESGLSNPKIVGRMLLNQRGLDSVPSSINRFVNMRVLGLSQNNIKTLPKELADLKNLVTLDLSNNPMESLPDVIWEIESLERLMLNGLALKSLPAGIGKLKNLKYLEIKNNALTELPEEIGSLSNLVILETENNKLSTLPKSLRKLKKLKSLTLKNNQFLDFPFVLARLESLESLNISYNQITQLPKEIKGLERLSHFNIARNKLNVLGKELCELDHLTILNASHNYISILSEKIGALKNLVLLDLSHNKISALQNGLWGLEQLKTLKLDFNQLQELPTGIGNLSRLSTLWINDNLLSSVPNEVYSSVYLNELVFLNNDLSNEQLKELSEFKRLKYEYLNYPDEKKPLGSVNTFPVSISGMFDESFFNEEPRTNRPYHFEISVFSDTSNNLVYKAIFKGSDVSKMHLIIKLEPGAHYATIKHLDTTSEYVNIAPAESYRYGRHGVENLPYGPHAVWWNKKTGTARFNIIDYSPSMEEELNSYYELAHSFGFYCDNKRKEELRNYIDTCQFAIYNPLYFMVDPCDLKNEILDYFSLLKANNHMVDENSFLTALQTYYSFWPNHKNDTLVGLNDLNIAGKTPLMYACEFDYILASQEIILRHADVNTTSLNGTTALMYACMSDNVEMILLLKRNGASEKIKDSFGKRASDYCKTKEAKAAVGLKLN
ncbi:MAG: leucine-rich repeat domain-containing protein [Crocinitomicaceae bacterium]|nr:leucine-rich repeat domain-containing protein [Crocinitomicaceae bacterium]